MQVHRHRGGANSVANSLTIQFNGNTNATFNGSAAKTVNITPSAIGAAASSHGRHVPDVCTTITDWNSATTNGWYMAYNASNAPFANDWHYGFVIANSTSYVRQILYRFAADNNVSGTNCDRYERVKNNGTWGSWVNTSVHIAVPANAKFTDTNTWRGIQNNLTSTSTTDSLSAAQGKILNELTFQRISTVVVSTTDWDTLTAFGCYRVQITSWGNASTYHSPNQYADMYSYGLLLVFKAYNDGENRTVQIYMPHNYHGSNTTCMTRMLNAGGWTSWIPLGKNTPWSEISGKPSTFPPSSHNHDTMTNSEIDALFA